VLLKSLVMSDIRKIDGIWTRHELELSNHKTGHRSQFIFSDVDYLSPIDDDVFTQRAIVRGL